MEFTQIRVGTTDNLDIQLLKDGNPSPLGSPSSVALTRRRMSDGSTLTNITLTVEDAPNGKVRWTPTGGQTATGDGGYGCTIVVTGGTNAGTYPTHGTFYIGVME